MTVHPHACGENEKDEVMYLDMIRSTPTRVGKTARELNIQAVSFGPPPRVWGKPVDEP